jgi:hypothetical protein
MNPIAIPFLRAKHWHLLLLLLTLLVIPQVAFSLGMVGAVILAFIFLSVGWVWSAGSYLVSITPLDLRPSVGFFRFAVFYELVYPCMFMAVMLGGRLSLTTFLVVLPFHFFGAFLALYGLYFVTRALALAEKGKAVGASEWIVSFFLLWFFLPVGVWVVQPKINRLYATTRNAEPVVGIA